MLISGHEFWTTSGFRDIGKCLCIQAQSSAQEMKKPRGQPGQIAAHVYKRWLC